MDRIIENDINYIENYSKYIFGIKNEYECLNNNR